MGSFFELNDTLQLTKEQGFPVDLDLEKHLITPYKAEEFEGKVFSFKDKPAIRIFQAPPVRTFFVENRNDMWIYWGHVHILSTICDYEAKTTSGTFKIIHINDPEEMEQAFNALDRRPDFNHFKKD
jgi:hypothetical protein